MRFSRTWSMLSVAASLVAIAPSSSDAQGTGSDPVLYELVNPPSQFEWGCFGPCACPVLVQSPLTGSFVLRRSHVDPLYTWYDVLELRWKVPGAEGHTVTIMGAGTYRRGGEVALQEELTLDLAFDAGPSRHFTSGLRSPGASFPEISTRIALHENFCFDSALVVSARPVDLTGAGDGSRAPRLALSPNPFTSATEIDFVVPKDGVVELGVFDLAGRRVSAIVEREWLPSGAYHRAWDGRRDQVAVPPGFYLVRLDSPAGRTVRTLMKL